MPFLRSTGYELSVEPGVHGFSDDGVVAARAPSASAVQQPPRKRGCLWACFGRGEEKRQEAQWESSAATDMTNSPLGSGRRSPNKAASHNRAAMVSLASGNLDPIIEAEKDEEFSDGFKEEPSTYKRREVVMYREGRDAAGVGQNGTPGGTASTLGAPKAVPYAIHAVDEVSAEVVFNEEAVAMASPYVERHDPEGWQGTLR